MRSTWSAWRAAAEAAHPDPYPQDRCWFCPEPIGEDDVPLLAWRTDDPNWMIAAHPECCGFIR